jgi:hypothetical protein
MDTCFIIIFFIVFILFFFFINSSNYKETFTNTALNSIGGFNDQNGRNTDKKMYDHVYEYGSQYNPFFPITIPQNEAKKENFLNTPPPPKEDQSWIEQKTIERLNRVEDKLLPKVSTNLTPYNVDVADPIAYSFQVHAPRVIRKDKLAMEADPLRGDVPITYYPDIPIIEKSIYNRDSLRLDGLFSDAFKAQYDRLTGNEYLNAPFFNSYGTTTIL